MGLVRQIGRRLLFGIQINLLVLYLFSLSINLTFSRILKEARLSCQEAGNFSIVQDCGVFVTCYRGEIAIGACPEGQNFDAIQHACSPQELVDCSRHVTAHPPRGVSSNNLKKRSLLRLIRLARSPINTHLNKLRRQRRSLAPLKSPTRPWGKWVNGTYVPYLLALEKVSCVPLDPKRKLANGKWVDGKWIDYDEQARGQKNQIEEDEEDEVEPEEANSPSNPDGPKESVAPNQPIAVPTPTGTQDPVEGKKVTFLTEDLESGGSKEALLANAVQSASDPKVLAQVPDKVATEGVAAPVEKDSGLALATTLSSLI